MIIRCFYFRFLLFSGLCSHLSNDILRLHLATDPPNLDTNTVCMNYPYLSSAQFELCKIYPDVTASAIQGVQVAVHECQFQMKTHRWNCSTLETKNKNPEFSPVFKRGKKINLSFFVVLSFFNTL